MKYIEVHFDHIDYESVCNCYNARKPDNSPELKRLYRAEGGFRLDIKNDEGDYTCNNNSIKQLRWYRKKLHTPIGMVAFDNDEHILLYDSLVSVYGNDKVSWYIGPLYK